MNQVLTVVIGALIGAVAAISGSWINAHSLRNQVKNQAVIEHGHWRRQSRSDAYEQFIYAAYKALKVLERSRIEATDIGKVTSLDSLEDSLEALSDASIKVVLAGPALMSDFASEICKEYRIAKDILAVDPVIPVEATEWEMAIDSILNLTVVFPLAARKVLDASTPSEIPYPNEDPLDKQDGESEAYVNK